MVANLDLLAFIRRSIPSVWAMDVLLLVRQAPARSWSAGELVGELRASDAVVMGALAGLQSEGLVAEGEDGRFRFAPVAAALEELTDALAQAYAERPVAVINAIVSNQSQLEALADAFRLAWPRR
ncbi:hypothetical protein QO010_004143 [Caulobacter ginsengisoli]|jgi:hypothetical protein|uniref:Transcriptional regulator n=1 Tax=Caulobacter ginsengisoli TaxID=400775 RepID=A0ABU0IYB7_9CAUL|nr:hypothetical protein [Caulobacter ginsengisoli]MDQ0466350.1 hypothetical protein [Caulobacter ginsengisoli]